MVVYPDPTQLSKPVRVIEGVKHPYGVVFNSSGEMYVAENLSGQVAVFDGSGKKIGTIGSRGGQFQYPCSIAIDKNDFNVYITSDHNLQKFTRNGDFIKGVGIGNQGNKFEQFSYPKGVKVHQNRIYVCDNGNHRIQVFDLELRFITSFGTKGSGQGQYDRPCGLDFDSQGNIYVSEDGNN